MLVEDAKFASEDKNDAESRKFCCNSKNIKRILNSDDRALRDIGLFRQHCISSFLFHVDFRILSLSL